jgi:hypothetical protein
MSPISVESTAGGSVYGHPFLGPVDHAVAIDVLLSALTSREIDANGFIKPGVILSRNGLLIAPNAAATPGAAVAGAGNVGDGTVGSLTSDAGAPTETITLTLITVQANAGVFSVVGSVSGVLPNATVAVAYNSAVINFTIADGAADFELGDTFTIVVTGGAQAAVFGVVVEAIKVAADNASGTLAALTTPRPIVVGIEGTVKRDVIEDNLGAPLTDDEVNGFASSKLTLL